MRPSLCQKITRSGIQQSRGMRTRRTARALRTALRKRKRRRRMMTKQYYEWSTVFAHICKFLLFRKCIINQKQCRTDVDARC
uniref:Uncharacterized protein n=1 Tax=Equus caballus TaxID=9796 RepID=A0A9L0TAB4_HORSE